MARHRARPHFESVRGAGRGSAREPATSRTRENAAAGRAISPPEGRAAEVPLGLRGAVHHPVKRGPCPFRQYCPDRLDCPFCRRECPLLPNMRRRRGVCLRFVRLDRRPVHVLSRRKVGFGQASPAGPRLEAASKLSEPRDWSLHIRDDSLRLGLATCTRPVILDTEGSFLQGRIPAGRESARSAEPGSGGASVCVLRRKAGARFRGVPDRARRKCMFSHPSFPLSQR